MATYRQACVQLESADTPLATECRRALQSRGIVVESFGSEPTETSSNSLTSARVVHVMVLEKVPTAKHAAALAEEVSKHAASGIPPVLLIPLEISGGGSKPRRSGDEHAASLALLRAHGAIVLRAPDVWLECIVLLAAHGLPPGPQAAIVAQPEGWLAAAAAALQKRAEAVGERFSPLAQSQAQSKGRISARATDFVLTDASAEAPEPRNTQVMLIPVGVPASESKGPPCLSGLANALAAAEHAGQASLRIAAGDGPAPSSDAPRSDIDQVRFDRQLSKLGTSAGDHECKVLLSSYSVAITRQAVATTPSAATRIAKKAGYPVQLKAWGAEQPSEPEGALVQAGVATAADVRRAFSSVCAQANCEAVIIRETPMSGREIRVHIRPMGAVGLVCFLYQRGRQEPVAALAPLRSIDADSMARQVIASRSGDHDPDWSALASLLENASHMVADTPRMTSVELSRVIVGNQGEGALVVDARAELEPA